MQIPIFQVDAFTDIPFQGNPAAVCLLETAKEDAWMQNVASEMNLSETAFVQRRQEGDGFNLRWFTPLVEVDLCGHATLATAHILWENNHIPSSEPAYFHTRSGILSARNMGAWLELDFPLDTQEKTVPDERLIPGLGLGGDEILYIGRSRFDYIVEVAKEEIVRRLTPHFSMLAKIESRGFIVTAQASADSSYDFVSRFFAPAVGIDEDPVTGSAHCCLGPYWQERLGRDQFIAQQVSKRGGVLKLRVDAEHVYISGQAVTILQGFLQE